MQNGESHISSYAKKKVQKSFAPPYLYIFFWIVNWKNVKVLHCHETKVKSPTYHHIQNFMYTSVQNSLEQRSLTILWWLQLAEGGHYVCENCTRQAADANRTDNLDEISKRLYRPAAIWGAKRQWSVLNWKLSLTWITDSKTYILQLPSLPPMTRFMERCCWMKSSSQIVQPPRLAELIKHLVIKSSIATSSPMVNQHAHCVSPAWPT